MNNSWRTKADVLKDIGAVNGRRTGVEDLDHHVVQGERPPPIRHEAPDEDEINYFSAGLAGSAAEDNARGPDLDGISVMLEMVNNMDDRVYHNEPMTLYHNRATDRISISKLNPSAGEYVPGRQFNGGNRQTKMQVNVPQYTNGTNNFSNNMFKSRNETSTWANRSPNRKVNTAQSNNHSPTQSEPNLLSNGLPKRTIDKSEAKDMFSPSKATNKSNEVKKSQEKITSSPSTVASKADEIKEIQEKIKSTIIASSNDNSLKTKRQKNVAIATLLKMGAVSSAIEDKPVKLIKPDYFENPPAKTELKTEETPVNGGTEEARVVPSTSNDMNLNYVDPDSISKVTGWFNSLESPKPKQQPKIQDVKPLVLKDAITFKKKKGSSSASSHISEASKEKKEPAKEPKDVNTPFEPSSYADELLKKYEDNAKRAVSSREDLGTMLERQLRERDELVRQKMLARQKAG